MNDSCIHHLLYIPLNINIFSSFHVKIIMSINSSYTSSNQILLLVYVKNTRPKDERKRKRKGEGERLKLISCVIMVKVINIIN